MSPGLGILLLKGFFFRFDVDCAFLVADVVRV